MKSANRGSLPYAGRVLRLLVAASMGVPLSLAAQRTPGNVESASHSDVARIIEAARARGLPTALLQAKAQEGAAKGASERQIVDVLVTYANALDVAQNALGSADDVDVEAGASAVRMGVTGAALQRLRAAGATGSMGMSFVVMVDLITRGVPVDTAVEGLSRLMEASRGRPDLKGLQTHVARVMSRGGSALAAFQSYGPINAPRVNVPASLDAATRRARPGERPPEPIAP
ncbi:MAG: hypothetical protein ABIY52_09980 [Gemmatimonadaceae bacterium]